MTKDLNRKCFTPGIIALIIGFFLVMVPLSWVDYDWTLLVHRYQIADFGEIMRRSFIQGGRIGAQDPSFIFIVFILLTYLFGFAREKTNRLSKYRPHFGYILFTCLITVFGIEFPLKWIVGRARPDLVVKGQQTYSAWYQFGSQFVSDGIYYGSFPSGHTVTVFLLITVTYAILFDVTLSKKIRVLGGVFGILVFILTGLMILGRSMTLDHWLSDSIGVVFISWLSVHVTYFSVLKVPDQQRYLAKTGKYPETVRYWELSLAWRILLISCCTAGLVFGVRSVWLGKGEWLAILVIPAIIIGYFLIKSLKKIHRKYMNRFCLQQADV